MKHLPVILRKTVKSIMIALFALLMCLLIIMGILLVNSPGKVKPFFDKNGNAVSGSISEKIYVNINGIKQGMFIRGKNGNNPVVLFLHGGPGMPEYFLAEKYMSGLEDNFTVCYWERRGSGLSYSHDMPPESVTLEQSVSDTIEVTNYLRKRFGQDKIYLMAHSYGTFLGIQAAERAPQLYCAYIGVAQEANEIASEKEAYGYMLKYYKSVQNYGMLKKLKKYPVLSSNTALKAYLSSPLRDEAMHKAGIGTMHSMNSVVTGVVFPVMMCHAYTLNEKINIWKGKVFCANTTELMKLEMTTDLTLKVTELKLPLYVMSGKYDYTVSYNLTKSYFNKLKAPVKGFYTFENSAHSPMFEEPGKFFNIMKKDVLSGKTNLADKN